MAVTAHNHIISAIPTEVYHVYNVYSLLVDIVVSVVSGVNSHFSDYCFVNLTLKFSFVTKLITKSDTVSPVPFLPSSGIS